MEKNQIIEIKIEDMLDDGRGFGRYDGCAVFVSGSTVPGDIVRARITKAKKNSAEAVLEEIIAASPDRTVSDCPYFGECGGCSMRELSYDAQKRLKTEQVRSKLKRLGGLEDPKVNDIIGADDLQYYRNKAEFAVGPHGEVGFKKKKSHFVMDVDDCLLQTDAAMVCADALRAFLREHPYVQKGDFPITGMTVRTAFGTGEVMAVLETAKASDAKGQKRSKKKGGSPDPSGAGPEIPDMEILAEMLDSAVYSINQSEEGQMIRADDAAPEYSLESVALIHQGRCRIIAGKPTITEEFVTDEGVLRFEISPQSFFQVNPEQMVKLYDKAAEYAGVIPNEHDTHTVIPSEHSESRDLIIMDLYCGAGTIGIWLLGKLRSSDPDAFEKSRVIGIEAVKPAVIDANRNSVINGLVNTRYICGKAEEELPGMMGISKLYKWNEVNERVEREPDVVIRTGGEKGGNDPQKSIRSGQISKTEIDKVDVILLDPPRSGCDEALLHAAAAAAPDRIVYVSCDPATLARDVKYLCANGYEFIEATPVDQFPWTTHIETVCLLSKLSEAKHHISVQVDMEELDITAAESKATYEEIQEWVQEKYGFHVTHLNIAQVKRKHGIIERENYNKPKSLDSKQPGCPDEKVKAIEAALSYFQMI